MTENLFPFPENFNMYAILDHCREIQVLTDQQRILKATPSASIPACMPMQIKSSRSSGIFYALNSV
ncbi:MAG: hypothetical protein J6S57_02275 [Alphaproteobacteria bacterium]|nr:hypothetical protein [Alphaproteobacteria bacterium]